METLCILFSFNRPKYLKQVIDSLVVQTRLTRVDWFLMQDHPINRFTSAVYAEQGEFQECVHLLHWFRGFVRAEGGQCNLLINDRNRGMGWQKWKAMKYAFEENEYDACVCFEDDMIVSPHYVRLMQVLLRQYQNDPEVATVQLSDVFNDAVQPEMMNQVKPAWRHWWGYGTWRHKWLNQHKPYYERYFNLIKNCDYRDRPHGEIQKLIKDKHSSHDGALDWCVKENKQVKLAGMVSRATYIGEHGVHSTTQHFNSSGYRKRLKQVIEFKEDASLAEFQRV